MKKVVLMALALGLSLPAMASEKVIDMYKGKPVRCWRWPQEPGMPCCRWIPVA